MKNNFEKGGAAGTLIGLIVLVALVVIIVFALRSSESMTDSVSEEDTPAEMQDEKMVYEYNVRLDNVSEDQPLSPGVYVVHTDEANLNFAGSVAPAPLEPLAEYGSHQAFAEFVAEVPGVLQVVTVDDPIVPGSSAEFVVAGEGEDLYLSGIQMAVASNDGYTLIDALALNGEGDAAAAANYDAGTEENSELGSGFEGGQPDPEQGEANIDNGTATDPHEPVARHDQLTETLLQIQTTVQ
jgi:hypothetical protein